MTTKQDVWTSWADLARRLNTDGPLASILEEIDLVTLQSGDKEGRRRLKVPYANTTSLDEGASWQ